MKKVEFKDGLAINGDSTSQEIVDIVKDYLGNVNVPLIATDPPYGNIVMQDWDRVKMSDDEYADHMIQWTRLWSQLLEQGGAFYVWGGIGLPNFRPFIKYLTRVEDNNFKMSNLITWSKKRAYGVQNNYLFTREELCISSRAIQRNPSSLIFRY